jgi:hypothetical protein
VDRPGPGKEIGRNANRATERNAKTATDRNADWEARLGPISKNVKHVGREARLGQERKAGRRVVRKADLNVVRKKESVAGLKVDLIADRKIDLPGGRNRDHGAIGKIDPGQDRQVLRGSVLLSQANLHSTSLGVVKQDHKAIIGKALPGHAISQWGRPRNDLSVVIGADQIVPGRAIIKPNIDLGRLMAMQGVVLGCRLPKAGRVPGQT